MDWHAADAPQALKRFKALCEFYFSGPLKEKSEEEQISYLQIWSGEEGIELVSTWNITSAERKKLTTYWQKFEDYVSPRSNFRLARYKLRTLIQEPGEPIDSYIKKLRILVKDCKYENADEHIIDTLIFGSNSKRVQSKLLEHDQTLTLDKAIDIARTEEATSQQLNDIASGSTQVHTLRKAPTKPKSSRDKPDEQREPCGNCGKKHDEQEKELPCIRYLV